MKMALRVLIVLAVFVGVGWFAFHAVLAHTAVRTSGYAPEARLGAYAAGLFAGGAAAVLTLITLLLVQAKR